MSVSLRSALRDTLGLAVRRRSAARTWRVVQRAAHRPHVANLRDVHHDWHEDGGEAIIAMKTPAIENAVLPTFPDVIRRIPRARIREAQRLHARHFGS